MHGYREWVFAVEFSPDGRRLATCPLNGTIVIADTIPLRQQLEERREALAVRRSLEPLVLGMLDRGLDPSEVAASLRGDESLTDSTRHAALRVLLEEASPRRQTSEARRSPG